jgi:hypothetical protein
MMNKLLITALLFIFTSNGFTQVPSYVPTSGLVGYWPFNGNANDESGNGNNGTVNGATLTTDRNGNVNRAYSFNGVSDFINVPSNTGLNLIGNFTLSAWVKLANSSISNSSYEHHFILSKNGGITGQGTWHMALESQTNQPFQIHYNADPCFCSNTMGGANSQINDINWHLINISYNSTNQELKYFLDGNLVYTSTQFNYTNQITTYDLLIGKENIGVPGFFNGKIDDIGIWNRALTQQEITNLFTSSLPPPCSVSASDSTICLGETVSLSVSSSLTSNTSPCVSTDLPINLQSGLVGYWPFCGNANDVSGNGNNGAVNGATLTSDRFGNANSAYSFDGGSAFISLSAAFFNGSTSVSSMSYSTWVNINSLPANGTSFAISNKEGYWRSIGLSINSDGSFSFGGSQPSPQGYFGISSQPNSISSNTWSLLSVTFSNGVLKLYKDGVQVAITTASYSQLNYSYLQLGNSTSTNHFGAAQPVSPGLTAFFNGTIDEFATWDRELTASEIQQLYNQGQNTYSWSNGATTSTTSVSPTATATYSCTVTSNGVSCTDDVTILVDTPPTPTITPSSSTSICSGGSLTLTSSSATGNLWATGETAQSIVVSTAGNYGVTVTNTSGCSALSLNTTVNVNALPTVNAGIDQAVCAGTSVTLSGTGTNTYSWDNGVIDGVLFTPAANTTYTLTGTNTSTGCTNTDQVDVTVNTLPTINAGIDQTVCAGTSVTLSGTGTDTYSWDNGVIDGVLFTPAANTTYTLTGTNTSTGCTNTDQVDVTVNALPTINAGIDQTVCAGTAVTLSGTGANTYSWDNSVIDGVLFTPSADATYIVTGTNTATGCTNTDQVDVTVNALPTINAGIDQTVCAGTTVTLSGTGADTYSWDNAVTDGLQFTPTANITYTVTGINTSTGCTNTDQVDVTVNALPTINAGIDQTVCAGTTVTLSGTGADTYSWDNAVTDGLQFTPTANITYTVTGINTVTGCTNTDQVTVTVNALPTVNAGNDQTICAGTSVTLSGTGADTYSWDNAVIDGLQFTPTANITYTVTGINTVTGCTNSDQVTVTVNALPTVNAGNDQTICAGTSVTLSGTGADTYSWDNAVIDGISFVPTATEIYHLQGTDLNGCQGIDSVQVIVNNTSTSTLTETALDSYTLNGQTYTQSGTYSQVIPNAAGCDSTITLNLTLNFTGIDEMKDFAVSIYPNPSRDVLFIHSEIELFSSFELIDNQGRIVLSDKLNGNQTSIYLDAIAPGNYYLKIEERNILIKVVKQ